MTASHKLFYQGYYPEWEEELHNSVFYQKYVLWNSTKTLILAPVEV